MMYSIRWGLLTAGLTVATLGVSPRVFAKDKGDSAQICDADHLKPLFDKKDSAGCQKTFDETSNIACNSAPEFAALLAAKKECLRSNLDRAFDEHTLKIDEDRGTNGKRDSEIQNAFLRGVEKFCQSACSRGDPLLWRTFSENCQARFFEYRMKQLAALGDSSFDLPTARSSKDYNGGDRIKSAFGNFAKLSCKVNAGWREKKVPKDCEKRQLSQITLELEVRKDPCDLS